MNLTIKPGDTLIVRNEIINISGGVIFEKRQKVTVTEIITSPGYWSKLCPDIYVPEKIVAVKLAQASGHWSLDTFVHL